MPSALVTEVAEELNVRSIDPLGEEAGLVDVSVKPNFRELGNRYGKTTPVIAQAIVGADPNWLVESIRSTGSAPLTVDSGTIDIRESDVIVTESPREGWAVASDNEDSVAIDLHIDDTLRLAGLARELVRAIQEARKVAGFDITDRIHVTWESSDPDIAAAFEAHGAEISGEVLAVEMERRDTPVGHRVETDLPATIAVERV